MSIMLTTVRKRRSMVIMTFNQMKQNIIVILGLQGLCFTMVEAREQ